MKGWCGNLRKWKFETTVGKWRYQHSSFLVKWKKNRSTLVFNNRVPAASVYPIMVSTAFGVG